MNNVEMTAREAVRKNVENVSDEAAMILRTMRLVGGKASPEYLIKLVRGYSKDGWKVPEHTQLETFGTLAHHAEYQLKHVVHVLFEHGLLEAATPTAQRLTLTPKGEAFLDKAQTLEVPSFKLRLSKHGYMLLQALRSLRRELSERSGREMYDIFSEFAMMQIVRRKPRDMQELRKTTGITLYKAEEYGEQVLEVLAKVHEAQRREYLVWLRNRVKAAAYQSVKELFLTGRSLAQIAKVRGLQESSVVDYLTQLHIAGEIDIRPWIEKFLDPKVLYKGAEYFRTVINGRYKEAYEVLGIRYESLKLCKLYVSDVQTMADELELKV